MIVIKLAQFGKKNKKMFRLVISEKNRDPYGDVLEILGSYNPHSKALTAKTERVKHWLSKGAQMTATVNNLLIEKKIIEGKKAIASKVGQKSEKRVAQLKVKGDKKATREATPSEAPKEEAPVEEIPAEEKTEKAAE